MLTDSLQLGDFSITTRVCMISLTTNHENNLLGWTLAMCLQVAQQCGILVDPIYNLSAWTTALHLASQTDGELQPRPSAPLADDS